MPQLDASVRFAAYFEGDTLRVRVMVLQPGKPPFIAPVKVDSLPGIAINATEVFCDMREIGKL